MVSDSHSGSLHSAVPSSGMEYLSYDAWVSIVVSPMFFQPPIAGIPVAM